MTRQIITKILSFFIAVYFTLFTSVSNAQNLRFFPDKDSSVVVAFIQDLHGQPEAQKNIAEIIDDLSKHQGFNALFLEGGLKGGISPNLLRFYRDEKFNEKIALKLLKEGAVGGPELFLLKHPGRVKAYGVESKHLYEAHLSSFRKVYAQKNLSEKFLRNFKEKLYRRALEEASPRLRKFLSSWLRYRETDRDLFSHLILLSGLAKSHLNLDLQDPRNQFEYPQLLRFFTLNELEKSMNPNESSLRLEKEKLDRWVKSHGLQAFYSSNSRHSLEAFYQQAAPKGFTFKDYPRLTASWGSGMLRQEMKGPALFAEMDQIHRKLLARLAQTDPERSLVQDFQDYSLLRKLFALELTREEYDQIKERGTISLAPQVALLEQDCLRFYRLAEQRDREMFENLMSKIKETKANRVILVAGGFHARGLEALMKRYQITFVAMTPKMEMLEPRQNYLNQMLASSSHVVPPSPGRMSLRQMPVPYANSFRSRFERLLDREGQGPAFVLHGLEGQSLGSEVPDSGNVPPGFWRKWVADPVKRGLQRGIRRAIQRAPDWKILDPLKASFNGDLSAQQRIIFEELKTNLESAVEGYSFPLKLTSKDQRIFAKGKAVPVIEEWLRKHGVWLRENLSILLPQPAGDEQYRRNLITQSDEFGIGILANVWRGSSQIHGHDGLLAVSVPLAEGMWEEPYQLLEDPGDEPWDGRLVIMRKKPAAALRSGIPVFLTRGKSNIHRIFTTARKPVVMLEIYFWFQGQPLKAVNNPIPVQGMPNVFYVRRVHPEELKRPLRRVLSDGSTLIETAEFRKLLEEAVDDRAKAEALFPVYTSQDTAIVDPEGALEYLAAHPVRVFRTREGSYLLEPIKPGAEGSSLGSQAAPVDFNELKNTLFQHINGLVSVPTLQVLNSFGAFDLFGTPARSKVVTLKQISQKLNPEWPEGSMGNHYGALRALALRGFLKERGKDENAYYTLTELGWRAVELARGGYLDETVAAIRNLKNYHVYFRGPPDPIRRFFWTLMGKVLKWQTLPPFLQELFGKIRVFIEPREYHAALREYQRLIENSRQGWNLPPFEDRVGKRLVEQLRKELDGMIMSPTMVALGMPLFKKIDGAIEEIGPAIFDLFDEKTRSLNLDSIRHRFHLGFLDAAFDLLVFQGMAERDPSNSLIIRLTKRGLAFITEKDADSGKLITSYGVTNAYLKSYEGLSKMLRQRLFGDPDFLGIDEDRHLDRVMDLWGASGAHKTYLKYVKEIIREIFNRPLDQQPEGISGVGSGDGHLDAALVDFILQETKRGKQLNEKSLVVIASDYNEKSRSRAEATLKRFREVAGVTVDVLFGDVTRPALYDQGIRERMKKLGKQVGAEDLIHTQMFIPHERKLTLRHRDQARAVLRDRLKKVNREALKKVLNVESLPEKEDELLPLVEEQFTVSHSRKGVLVPAVVSAADLVLFFERWAPYTLVVLELLTPRTQEMEEEVPLDPDQPMKTEQLAAAAYWGTHWISQLLIPRQELELCAVLAGIELPYERLFPSAKSGLPANTMLFRAQQAAVPAAASLGGDSEEPVRKLRSFGRVEIEEKSPSGRKMIQREGRYDSQNRLPEIMEQLALIGLVIRIYEELIKTETGEISLENFRALVQSFGIKDRMVGLKEAERQLEPLSLEIEEEKAKGKHERSVALALQRVEDLRKRLAAPDLRKNEARLARLWKRARASASSLGGKFLQRELFDDDVEEETKSAGPGSKEDSQGIRDELSYLRVIIDFYQEVFRAEFSFAQAEKRKRQLLGLLLISLTEARERILALRSRVEKSGSDFLPGVQQKVEIIEILEPHREALDALFHQFTRRDGRISNRSGGRKTPASPKPLISKSETPVKASSVHRLREIRTQLGWSQERLGAELNPGRPITQGTISTWERGERPVPPGIMEYAEGLLKKAPNDSPGSGSSLGRMDKTPFRIIDGEEVDILDLIIKGKFHKGILDALNPPPLKRARLEEGKDFYTIREIADLSQTSEDQKRSQDSIKEMIKRGYLPAIRGKKDAYLVPRESIEALLNGLNIPYAAKLLGVTYTRLQGHLKTPEAKALWQVRQFSPLVFLVPISVVEERRNKLIRQIQARLVWKYFRKAGLIIAQNTFQALLKEPPAYLGQKAVRRVLGKKNSLIQRNVYGNVGDYFLLKIGHVWKLFRELKKMKKEARRGLSLKQAAKATGLSKRSLLILIALGKVQARKFALFVKSPGFLIQPEELARLKKMRKHPRHSRLLRQLIVEGRRRARIEGKIRNLNPLHSPRDFDVDLIQLRIVTDFYKTLLQMAREEGKEPDLEDFNFLKEADRVPVIPVSEVLARFRFDADFILENSRALRRKAPNLFDKLLLQIEDLEATLDDPEIRQMAPLLDRLSYEASGRMEDFEREQAIGELREIERRLGVTHKKFCRLLNPEAPVNQGLIFDWQEGIRPIPPEILEGARALLDQVTEHIPFPELVAGAVGGQSLGEELEHLLRRGTVRSIDRRNLFPSGNQGKSQAKKKDQAEKPSPKRKPGREEENMVSLRMVVNFYESFMRQGRLNPAAFKAFVEISVFDKRLISLAEVGERIQQFEASFALKPGAKMKKREGIILQDLKARAKVLEPHRDILDRLFSKYQSEKRMKELDPRKRLRRARARLDLKLVQLGALLNVDPRLLSSMEQGKTPISDDILRRAEALVEERRGELRPGRRPQKKSSAEDQDPHAGSLGSAKQRAILEVAKYPGRNIFGVEIASAKNREQFLDQLNLETLTAGRKISRIVRSFFARWVVSIDGEVKRKAPLLRAA